MIDCGPFVTAALAFWNLEQRILADGTTGASLTLAQADGPTRRSDAIAAIVPIPTRIAA